MNQEIIDNIFKYHSKLPKISLYFLIAGVILFPIGWFLKDTYDFAYLFLSLGGGIVFFGLLFLLIYGMYYIIFKSKINKYSKKYDLNEIKMEMIDPSTLAHNDIFCTKNYLLSHNGGSLFICRYSELKWVFKCTRKYNGVTVGGGINGYIEGVRSMQQIVLNAYDKTIMDIFAVIKERNPNVLIGFTEENKQLYKSQR